MSMSLSFSLGMALVSSVLLSDGQPASRQRVYVEDGVGISKVVVDKSTAADVVSDFGDEFIVRTHNEYSREMEYAGLGLSFYYCLKDKGKRIFLVEARNGANENGIVIGQSTLKDVYGLYGKEDDIGDCDASSCVYEYKGVQFYAKALNPANAEREADPSQMRIVGIDVMSRNKSSNFCD